MATQTKTVKIAGDNPLTQLPFPEGIQQLQLTLFKQLQHHYTAFIEKGGDESLHDFRVALRRLRSLLRNYRDYVVVEARLIDGLRAMQQHSNRARDLEVFIAQLRHYCPEQIDWLNSLQQELAVEYQQLHRSLPPTWARLSPLLEKEISVTPKKSSSLGQITQRSALQQRRGLKRELLRLNKHWSEKTVHQLRIRAKRSRYLLEPFEENNNVTKAINRLKTLQEQLGDYRDLQLLIQQLKRMEKGAVQPSPVSSLIQSLQKQAKQQKKEAQRYRHHDKQQQLLKSVKVALQQLA